MNKLFENLKEKITNTIKELKGDIIVSNHYRYDYEHQKEIKQLYPNNDGIDVVSTLVVILKIHYDFIYPMKNQSFARWNF